MRMWWLIVVAWLVGACERTKVRAPLDAAPSVQAVQEMAPTPASAQPAEPAAPTADALPPGLHIVDVPGEASDNVWELRDEAGAAFVLPEAVREGLAGSLAPSIAGPTGALLVYDTPEAVMVYGLEDKQTRAPIALKPGQELLGYGTPTSGERIFAVTREAEAVTLWVAAVSGGEQPISLKISPHVLCGSRCMAPSVHFFDEQTIRYQRPTPDGEPGQVVEVKLP
jgi:hypothetical protein